MRIIQNAKETIAKYWGPSPCKDVDYRLIRYHIQAQCGEETLLLNTVTGELVALSPEEAEFLDHLPQKRSKQAEELIQHHFLVPFDYDELKSVNQLRAIFRKIDNPSHITGYSILPTSACNARCFYCFESSYSKVSMTAEMADKVVSYIEANCGGKKIWINWFGGEPMVGYQRICQICDQLNEKGIAFDSSMISNGSLFNKSLAQLAKESWHLRRIQITLDGSEEIYNRTKAYVGLNGNPYYVVLDNIGYLLDQGIRVNIRLNMDFHNTDDIPKVVDDLADRYSGHDNFYVYVHELFEDEGFEPVHHTREEKRVLEERRAQLEAYISERECQCASIYEQQSNKLPSLRHRYCMADNPASVMINPLGELGKCEHHLFKHLVGAISEKGNGIEKSSLRYWLDPDIREFCFNCVLFPFCGIPVTCDGSKGCRNEVMENQVSYVREQMKRVYVFNRSKD